ncbi:MAG: ADP-ribosylglycohydrolase family protein [Clostridia bacterium]|nr:ADP-ribosylglycohydrolase family protein [Clostridia bacterium]
MAGYDRLYALLIEELNQLSQEGRDIDCEKYRERINSCNEDKQSLMQIYSELCALPMRADYRYNEPSELEEIFAESDINKLPDDKYTPVDAEYFRGAWLGRCIGCALGQPVEGWQSERIIEWYKTAGKYPIKYYVPTVSGERRNEGLATDEKLCGMPLDDDTRFTVIFYLLLKQKGYNFDSWDIGSHWAWNLPFRFVCTAETQAYLNYINVDTFTPWYKPENALSLLKRERVNSYLNPYREWIGAQIRCDAFAYVAAGMPKLAARLAHTDAYFSHIKNGIYGEMFFAALIASAFTEKSVEKCFENALAVIPKNSRFYEDAVWARGLAESDITRDELIKTLIERGKKYSWVHTINNATFCIAAIMRYKNDFREAVAFAVECGADTDCNGATVGSFMGALLGDKGVPDDLKAGIKDRFSVGVSPYDNYSIKRFADEVKELCDKLNA